MLQIIAAWAASATIATSEPPVSLASHDPRPRAPRHGSFRTPGIRVWTSGGDLHRRGDRVQLYYRTERDAYVTVFRIDTDGRVQLLFPRYPGDENYGYGGATYSVANHDRSSAFYVEDYPGVGYIFAVASSEPFNYDPIIGDGRWDLHVVSDGRIHGDPRSSMEEIAVQLMSEDYADFDTHLLPYYVEQRYDYPRFVCYDCHAYTPWVHWDPYQAWCRRFTLVVFNDPYYYYPSYWYPTRYYGGRYYGGTRVVYTQPRSSRYVFKSRDDNSSSPGIDYRDRRTTSRTASTGDRRDNDDGVRGRDLGGVGSIPAPRTPNRRTAPTVATDGSRPDKPAARDAAGDDRRDAPSGGGSDPRRSAGEQQQESSSQADNGRRRVDRQPGIEIVPSTPQRQGEQRPSSSERPTSTERPSSDGRRPSATTPSSSDRPSSREAEPRPSGSTRRSNESRDAVPETPSAGSYGNEPRPARPTYTPHSEPVRQQREAIEQAPPRVEPRSQSQGREDVGGQPSRQPREPEARQPSQRESAPASEPREARPSQRDASPAQREASPPQREASPPQREASPPQRDARPSSPPPAPPPSSPRPQASPSRGQSSGGQSSGGSNPGLVRRRP